MFQSCMASLKGTRFPSQEDGSNLATACYFTAGNFSSVTCVTVENGICSLMQVFHTSS